MKKKLTEVEFEKQYHIRATLLAKLIGKHFGSGNRKRAQRVFQEPSRWTKWAVNIAPTIPTNKAKMVIQSPVHWLYLVGMVFFVRYLDKRRMTLKEAEKAYMVGIKTFIEKNDRLFDQLVDVESIKKYDDRITEDIEYGGDDSRNLRHRAKTTLVSALMDTPQDIGYPQVSNKITEQPRWQRWLGLKSGDSPMLVLWKAFRGGMTSTTKNISDIFSHLTARDIAREQGYNKGRLIHKTVNQLIDDGIVHKAHTDESGNVDEGTIVDQHSLDDINQIENNDANIEALAIEVLASKGIAYSDLTPKEWAVIFEHCDLIIHKGYEPSSKKGVSISDYYGKSAHAKEQKLSRIKQKVRKLTTKP